MRATSPTFVALGILLFSIDVFAADEATLVNAHNFARAESDLYFGKTAGNGGFGVLKHDREFADIDAQKVVRMNRDTLYSSGVFDLEAAPVTIALPDAGKRFMSLQVISEDHYTVEVAYTASARTYSKETVGTRYMYAIVRTLANPEDRADMEAAHRLQDAIRVEQARRGEFLVPKWDEATQTKARDALGVLGSLGGTRDLFGSKSDVDPVDHLIGAAIGWGGNPRAAAIYQSSYPARNDGKTTYSLTLRDVPVDGFWSVSVYNAKGYYEKNALGAYSLNNLTARQDADGSYRIRFGGCEHQPVNCLPITAGWNYTVRLYRPRPEVLDGAWRVPAAELTSDGG